MIWVLFALTFVPDGEKISLLQYLPKWKKRFFQIIFVKIENFHNSSISQFHSEKQLQLISLLLTSKLTEDPEKGWVNRPFLSLQLTGACKEKPLSRPEQLLVVEFVKKNHFASLYTEMK